MCCYAISRALATVARGRNIFLTCLLNLVYGQSSIRIMKFIQTLKQAKSQLLCNIQAPSNRCYAPVAFLTSTYMVTKVSIDQNWSKPCKNMCCYAKSRPLATVARGSYHFFHPHIELSIWSKFHPNRTNYVGARGIQEE